MDVVTAWEDTVGRIETAGIAVPAWAVVSAGEDVATATAGLRPPLAVKAVPGAVEHKSDAGMVAVGVNEPDAVAHHVARISDLQHGGPILVQEMVTSHVELLMSVRRDRDFGPVLTVGAGGVLVEVLDDVVHLALPVDVSEVETALRSLRISRLLRGFRGYPDRDVDSVVAAACALGDLLIADERLTEIELNPVMVAAEGAGCFAVDVSVSWRR